MNRTLIVSTMRCLLGVRKKTAVRYLLIDTRIIGGLRINGFIWRGCVINIHKSHAVRACFGRQRGRRFYCDFLQRFIQLSALHGVDFRIAL